MSKIEIRRLNFDFSANTERYWFKQSVFKTHLFNSITIASPEFEKYLIRTVKKESILLKIRN
jgi:predicted metal-dependent hydrolase